MSSDNTQKPKKPKIPRQIMPEQDPKKRASNFNEVALGYTQNLALKEAERCIHCKRPHCIEGCPVEVDITDFIALIKEKDFLGAARKIKEKNSLPSIAGRVCPQETQCEIKCVLGKKQESCAIGRLERFVADYERETGNIQYPEISPPTEKKVAVVGSGPAGLTLSGELIKKGVAVTVFEGLHELGGVLVYGIPEFRLPKEIVKEEINYLKKLGVEFIPNMVIGKIYTVDDLVEKKGFDAVFIGTGAGAPVFLNIPGENLCGVYSANEFLTRNNLMKAYLFPDADTPIAKGKVVAVFGGGNVAIYRRTENELPARAEEVQNAKEEGIIFIFLSSPLEFFGNDKGWVKKVKCQRMKLGEPDESGRSRPVPILNDFFEVAIDTAVIAIGNRSNPLVPSSTRNLHLNKKGNILADEDGRTSRKEIWAGGDIVTGAATVIQAMGAGRKAALSILKEFGII
jgi:glutamate synthase (NADPH/NADH) small chain